MNQFYDRAPVDNVAALGLPYPEETVVTHGSALVAWGIREANIDGDIDAVTNLENSHYLENELGFRVIRMVVGVGNDGKERTIVSRRDEADQFDFHRWDFSMHQYNRTGKGRIYLPELGSMSVQDSKTGIWVARPELVRLTMLESGRDKDAAVLPLIDDYIEPLA
jgi:hypothetical protein